MVGWTWPRFFTQLEPTWYWNSLLFWKLLMWLFPFLVLFEMKKSTQAFIFVILSTIMVIHYSWWIFKHGFDSLKYFFVYLCWTATAFLPVVAFQHVALIHSLASFFNGALNSFSKCLFGRPMDSREQQTKSTSENIEENFFSILWN